VRPGIVSLDFESNGGTGKPFGAVIAHCCLFTPATSSFRLFASTLF
jgi:hypothetical protein